MKPTFFLITVGVFTLVVSIALHLAGIFRNAFGCDVNGLGKNEYVAYCENERFADYEHGAVYYDLEPGTLQAMKNAKVLFLGNSRLQLGIDQEMLAREMDRAGISYFVLGFGYLEHYQFALQIIRRFSLYPSALVINADPFFEESLSLASAPLIGDKSMGEPILGNIYRRSLQKARWWQCHYFTKITKSRACAGYRFTIFRHRQTGSWRLAKPVYEGLPISPPHDNNEASHNRVLMYTRNAKKLLREARVSGDCAFIVGVPNSMIPADVAPRIAKQLNAPYVESNVDDLRSFDKSHLTTDSAQRWSAPLLRDLVPRLQRCIHIAGAEGARSTTSTKKSNNPS